VLRTALEALTLRLDGTRAAANTIIRKRAVLHGALGYAAETGLLPNNPLDSFGWQVPQSSAALDPTVVASPAQVGALLDVIARTQPTATVTVSPGAPEPLCRTLLLKTSLTSKTATSPHGCPGPSTSETKARAARARSASPARVTLSRTATLAMTAPVLPCPHEPGEVSGPQGGLERLANTVSAWWPEILAFLDTGITNAGSEGTNRVIKTVARDAYGFRNPVSQRLRTRCATTRKRRGFLNPHNFDEPLVTPITCPAYLAPSVRGRFAGVWP
jgi:hypothetical protein